MNREKIAGLAIFVLNLIIFFILLVTQKYSPFLVILNIISIVIVWIWLLNPKKLSGFFKKKKTDFYIGIILFVSSLAILIYKIDTVRPGMYGDEMFAASYGKVLLHSKEMPPFIDTYVHPLVHTYFVGWSDALFGSNIFAIRFPTIIAGAFSAIAIYVLLRQFFKKKIALIASLIFVFSYQHFVVFRQSYETGESVLFQIVALIFLYLLYKRKDIRSLIAFGMAIGASLHFYISIRTIAFSMVLLSIYFLRKLPFKKFIQYLVILLISLFISTTVLSSYAVVHWDKFWQRVPALSVFGRNLPAKDVEGEIFGSIKNDAGLFIFSGDPNPRYNPSGVPLYDYVSSTLIISGFIWLFFKQRKLFYIFLFLSLPIIANEIFAIEVFPEFHYYGTGHPNSLRISGFIPLFYLLMGFALAALDSLLVKINKQLSNIALISICIFTVAVNLYFYFGQLSINPTFFMYNYRFGDAYMQDIVKFINNKNIHEIYVQKPFINGNTYLFLNKNIKLIPINEKDIQTTLDLIAASKVVIVNEVVSTVLDTDYFNKLAEKVDEKSIPYIRLNTPFGPYGAVIFNLR